MGIITRESLFEYQIKQVIETMKKDYEELQNLDGEDLSEKIWYDYSKEFGRAMLDKISDYSGEELFESNYKV